MTDDSSPMGDGRIAIPRSTCWRRPRADRVAFLVDAERCFGAIGQCLLRAERSVLIVGWDLHSKVMLWRDEPPPGVPPTLGELLTYLLRRRRRLHVHVLVWDFSMLYATERELFSSFHSWGPMPRRLHFRYDGAHPVGGSHHQKIVVVDDSVAFAGGLDLTARRWDTRDHHADDQRRVDPWHGTYGPFHDVQMLVDGDAARALGDLVRDRWMRLTGRRPHAPTCRGDRWPVSVRPDVEDTTVGIARTLPPWRREPGVREIEQLYLEAIRAARDVIYIENQYLTAHRIGQALAATLAAPEGPEIIYVGPFVCSGWLEEKTMGVMRSRLLAGLEEADRHGRLHAYFVRAPDGDRPHVTLHSKVMVIDDRYAQVGSANLSNRSMGLDSECDLVVEATSGSAQAAAIDAFRCTLVAEHLRVEQESLTRARRRTGSLAAAIESLRTRHDTMVPLRARPETTLERMLPDWNPVDPERPVSAEELTAVLWPGPGLDEASNRAGFRVAWGLAVAAVLMATWLSLPDGWTEPERLAALGRTLGTMPGGALIATLVMTVAATVMVPFVPLVVAAGLLFGPWLGFAVALGSGVASAMLSHAIGHQLWHEAVRRRSGRLRQILSQASMWTIAALRIVPVAPFAIVNLIAGSVGVSTRDFLLGTLLGLAPGVLGLTVVAGGAVQMLQDPSWRTVATIVVTVLALGVGITIARTLLTRRLDGDTAADGGAS